MPEILRESFDSFPLDEIYALIFSFIKEISRVWISLFHQPTGLIDPEPAAGGLINIF